MKAEAIRTFVNQAAGEIDLGGFLVPAINAPVILLDELRDVMLEDDPPFAAIYWDEPDGRAFVIFAKENGVNVRKIAELYRGQGDMYTAAFKTPPQKEISGELIPIQLEFPPDDMDVLALVDDGEGFREVTQVFHIKDGTFKTDLQVLAWAYMPELPDGLSFEVEPLS
jgi:hypothetical protein